MNALDKVRLDFTLDHDLLLIHCCSGAFGKVYKGELLHSQGSGKKLVQTVAIKTIKSELQ